MSGAVTVFLALQGVAFIVWAYASFRALFGARRIAVEATGGSNPGPFAFVSGMRAWIGRPETRLLRRLWLAGFAGLVATGTMIALQAP